MNATIINKSPNCSLYDDWTNSKADKIDISAGEASKETQSVQLIMELV